VPALRWRMQLLSSRRALFCSGALLVLHVAGPVAHAIMPCPRPALQLSALVERHRFIRAVCRFHSASEEETVFPALQRMRGHGGVQQAPQAQPAQQGQHGWDQSQQPMQQAEQGQPQQQGQQPRDGLRVCQDHDEEGAKLEELGRLLGAVKAHAR